MNSGGFATVTLAQSSVSRPLLETSLNRSKIIGKELICTVSVPKAPYQ